MVVRRPRKKLLERLVVPQLRPLLPPGEDLLAWAHVLSPEGRRGILLLTPSRCVAHWPGRLDEVVRWDEVTGSRMVAGVPGELKLVLEASSGDIAIRLSAASRGQKRRAAQLLRTAAELTPAGVLDGVAAQATADFPVLRRGMRGYLRRVLVTTAGMLLVLLGLLFASPFLPGPGILTILAGMALLASEYDWAKDLHHWLRNAFERLLRRIQRRRRRRRQDAGAHDRGGP